MPFSRINNILTRKPYLEPLFKGYSESVRQALAEDGRLNDDDLKFISSQAEENTIYTRHFLNKSAQNGENSLENVDYYIERAAPSGRVFLNPPRRPVEGALRPAARFKSESSHVVVLCGLGSGHYLKTILDNCSRSAVIILVEQSLQLIYVCMEPFLLSALERDGFHLFLPGQEDMLYRYADGLPVRRFKGVRSFHYPPSYRLFPDYYNMVETRLHSIFSIKMSDLLTRLEFQKRWVHNIVINSLGLVNSRKAALLSSSFSNTAQGGAVLVSAGPSLRKSLPDLKTLSRKKSHYIMCVDTAFPVLVKAGIRVDALITLDAQSHSLFHFLDGADKEALNNLYGEQMPVLFTDMVGFPALVSLARSLGFETAWYQTSQYVTGADGQTVRETTAGMAFVEEAAGSAGDVQSGGSVATSAVDLLRRLGFHTICLVGQDLAYSGRKIHSAGTQHERRWLASLGRLNTFENINQHIIMKRNRRSREGLQGTVVTDYVLELYATWFEDTARSVETRLLNATLEGLKLEGIDQTALEQSPACTRRPSGSADPDFNTRLGESLNHSAVRLGAALSLCRQGLSSSLKFATSEGLPREVLEDRLLYPVIEKSIVLRNRRRDNYRPSGEAEQQQLLKETIREIKSLLRLFWQGSP